MEVNFSKKLGATILLSKNTWSLYNTFIILAVIIFTGQKRVKMKVNIPYNQFLGRK